METASYSLGLARTRLDRLLPEITSSKWSHLLLNIKLRLSGFMMNLPSYADLGKRGLARGRVELRAEVDERFV